MPNEGADAARRRLIFTNMVNRVPKAAVMAAFKRSEKEVDDDVGFVLRKLRSYRFTRAMPPIKFDTLVDAINMRNHALENLLRCNLDVLPGHGEIELLPFDGSAGHVSPAEQRLFEMRMRAASK